MSLVAASLQKKESPPAQRFCRTTGAAPVGAVSNLRVSEIANLFFFSSRRRHTSFDCDWSSDVCSSDLILENAAHDALAELRNAAMPAGLGHAVLSRGVEDHTPFTSQAARQAARAGDALQLVLATELVGAMRTLRLRALI